MTERENTLRAIRFERPEHIPMSFHINPACWHHYEPDVLQDLMESHPLLFPHFVRTDHVTVEYGLNQRADEPYTDPWGCVWETRDNGITGSVRYHPIQHWGDLSNYTPPDPEVTDGTFPRDWNVTRRRVRSQRERGELVTGGLPHGHTFLRLVDIRGYENLLYDMIDHVPYLDTLVDMVKEFNAEIVQRWLALKPDIMSYPEDLGMQIGPMLSPDTFRSYIGPVYQELMRPARDCGCIVHMHSDGDIRPLVDDLIAGGVDVINLQDLVNGVEWIAGRFSGKTCVDLDIDRQSVTARGTPQEIDDLIRREVEVLGTKDGGLMMVFGLYPGVPVENIRALMDAMERYSGFYA